MGEKPRPIDIIQAAASCILATMVVLNFLWTISRPAAKPPVIMVVPPQTLEAAAPGAVGFSMDENLNVPKLVRN